MHGLAKGRWGRAAWMAGLLAAGSGRAAASVQYDAVLEWTGPYFRVAHAETVDQLVDNPVKDIPFLQPYAIAAREHGAGERDVVYVADAGHNRIQVFEVNAAYEYRDRTDFTWRASGATAAAEFDDDEIRLPEWAGAAARFVIPYSEVVRIDGVEWQRVADLGAFDPVDEVYSIDYDDATDAPVIRFPAGSLASTTVFALEYAVSDEQTGAAPAFGIGDVDYGIGAGASPVLTEIDESSGGPSDWQQIRSIALIPNAVTDTSDDLFLVDAADDSPGQDEELFQFTVAVDGTVTYVEAYDDRLTTPWDVAVARSGASTAATASIAGGPGPFSAVAVVDANQVTGHTYAVVVVGGLVTITDSVTGHILVSDASFNALANACFVIPGLSLTKAGLVGSSMTVSTTRAIAGRYLFVADTGADRIKVVSAAEGPALEWPGDWLPSDTRTSAAQPSAAGSIGAAIDVEYRYQTPAAVPEDYTVHTSAFPVEEGSLEEITFDPDGVPAVWTRVSNLQTAGPADTVFELDWLTGRITFGDGTHGEVPPGSTAFGFDYAVSPDVVRYGSSGTGTGRFDTPKGIAARWNGRLGLFDLYVADSGNDRVQKLAFHPATLNLPARIDFLAQWENGANGSDTMVNPVDVTVALDRQDAGTGQTCYVAVADEGNDRILIYRDTAAMAGGGTQAPTYDTVLGESGNALSLYTQVDGVTFVQNGDDLDLYSVDGSRGVAVKYEESASPEITLSFTGSSELPRCFPPSSAYPFTFTTSNPPEGGWIDFYYDTQPVFNISTSGLCITSGAVPADAGSAEWVFSATPAGAPADHAGYYLFARMKDSSGLTVAVDQSEADDDPDERLCVDSDLVPTLRAMDAVDGDGVLYLQNGSRRIVELQIAYPESVVAVGFAGSFDTSLVRITGITRGSPWDGTGGVEIFSEDFDNTTGRFLVNSSATSAPTGLTGSGAYTVARIALEARPGVLDGQTRARTSTLTISPAGSGITDIHGAAPADWDIADLSLRFAYLGDLATTGTGADPQSAVPALAPLPDGKLDFADQMVFTLGWNGAANIQDPIADLGPVEGDAPDLEASPDARWDVDDIVAFTTMFSWASSNGYSAPRARPLAAGDPDGADVPVAPTAAGDPDEPDVPVAPTAAGDPDEPDVPVGPTAAGRAGTKPRIAPTAGSSRSNPSVAPSIEARAAGLDGAPSAGAFFEIEVRIREARALAGAWTRLEWDPGAYRLIRATNGRWLDGSDGSLFFTREAAGAVAISVSRLDRRDPGVDGDGVLARLEFETLREETSAWRLAHELVDAAGARVAMGADRAFPFASDRPYVPQLTVEPNPTRGPARIVWTLAETSPARIEIHDAAGRRVRTIDAGRLGPGVHGIDFDGRATDGAPLPSGVWFLRLDTGSGRETRKLTVIR